MADPATIRHSSPGAPTAWVLGDTPLVQRVRSELLEMRGFSPTLDQARRLFQLPADACRLILEALISDGFLQCGGDGRYRLAEDR